MARRVRLDRLQGRGKLVSRRLFTRRAASSGACTRPFANSFSRSLFLDSVDDLASFDSELNKYIKTSFITEK
ncbi:hypothetical protein IMZ48_45475 [Candidatus Bathyarchaeota archaeon]|nr:hypothetical protein [Candidatus Bathyarchaeota archaeon]